MRQSRYARQERTVTLGAAVILLIIVLMVVGWVKNVVKLSNCDFDAPYKCEIIHGVGVIPMVGVVTGWLTIEDGNGG